MSESNENSSSGFKLDFKSILIGVLVTAVAFLLLNNRETASDASILDSSSAPNSELYFQSPDMESLIERIRSSSVTIYCGDSAGSGWFIELEDSQSDTTDDAFPFEIVTNEHVVTDCDFEQPIYFTTTGNRRRTKTLARQNLVERLPPLLIGKMKNLLLLRLRGSFQCMG